MSKTVDSKVVEMRFDNSNFEKNIQQSMQSLRNIEKQLDGLNKTKGLETLNQSAKKVDFSPMSKGLDQVKVKFSALQVAGATTISQLTKKTLSFGKSLLKNTVGQIKTGGLTRALNLEQAQFQIEGLGKSWKKTKKDVLYGVKDTAYGLDEAARVSSQLLSSQVKNGKEMKTALRGISGVAAMTNSSYSDIGNIYTKIAGNGRMMSQELLQLSARGMNAAATLKDFVNANKDVRESMIKVGLQSKGKGKEVETFAKKTKLTEQNIRTLASAGAIDFKSFAAAMDKAFGKHATKANKTYEGSLANLKAALSRIGADIQTPKLEALRKIFNTLTPVIDKIHEAMQPFLDDIGKGLKKASSKAVGFIKNVSKKFDKTSVSFEKWQELTKKGFVNKTFEKSLKRVAKASGINIDKMIKKHGSFGKSLKEGWLKIDIFKKALDSYKKKVGLTSKDTSKIAKKTLHNFKEIDKVSNQVIRGNFGNGAARVKALTKAGYDYNTVQGLVNHKLIGTKYNFEQFQKSLDKTSDKQLKQQGYTKKEIKTLRALSEEAKKTGTPLNKLMEDLSKPTPFEATIGAIKNALQSTKKVAVSFGQAFKEIFFNSKSKNKTDWSDKITKISEKLKMSDKTASKLKRTFKGLFAAIDIVRIIVSGPLRIAFSIIKNVLKAFDIDILDATASIGDMIVAFRDWLKGESPFAKGINWLSKSIAKLITGIIKLSKWIGKNFKNVFKAPTKGIKEFITSFKNTKKIDFSPLLKGFSTFWESIKKIFSNIKTDLRNSLDVKGILSKESFDSFYSFIGTNLKKISSALAVLKRPFSLLKEKIENLFDFKKSLKSSNTKLLAKDIVDTKSIKKSGFILDDFLKKIKNTFSDFKKWFNLGPTKVKAADIVDTDGVVKEGKGFTSALDGIKIALSSFVKWIKKFFKNVDFFTVAGLGSIAATFGLLYKTIKTIAGLQSPLSKIGNFFGDLSGTLKEYQKNLKVERFTKIVVAIAVLAGVLFLLSKVPVDRLLIAAGVIIALAGAIFILAKASDKVNVSGADGLAKTMLSLSVSLLILTIALKRISDLIDAGNLWESIGAMAAIMTALSVMLIAIGKLGKKIEAGSKQILVLSLSILVLVHAIQKINDLRIDNVSNFLTNLTVVLGILASVFIMTNWLGKYAKKSGASILAITVSLLLFVHLLKVLDNFKLKNPLGTIGKLIAVVVAMGALLFATKAIGKNTKGAALTILAIAVAFNLIVYAIKNLSKLKDEAINKGVKLMVGFGLVVAGLIYVTKFAGENAKTIMMTLLSFAAAMVILVSLIAFIGNMDNSKLAKGTAVVLGLGIMVAILLNVSKHASKIGIAQLMSIVGAIAILSVVVYLLGQLNPGRVATGTLAIVALGVTVALLMKFSKSASKIEIASLFAMVAAIAVLSAAVYLLGQLNPSNAIVGTACVVALGMMIIALIELSQNSSKIAIASLFAMVAAISILAGVVYLLGTLDSSNVITATACIVALGIMIGILMAVSSVIGTEAIPGLLMIMGVVIVLGLVLGILASIKGADKVALIAQSISVLLLTLAAVLLACVVIGALAAPAITGAVILIGFIAVVTILLLAMGALAQVAGGLLSSGASLLLSLGEFLNQFISTAGESILKVMTLAIAIGVFAPLAIAGLTILMGFIGLLTAVMVALGALAAIVEPFIDKGGPLLVKIGSYIGQFVGAFIGGIIEQAAQSLPALAIALSAFGVGIAPFIASMNAMPNDIASKIGGLVVAVLAIIATDFLSKVSSFLTGGDPIDDFVGMMVRLGKGLTKFSNSIQGMDPESTKVATQALLGISELRNSLDSTGGVIGFFAGNKDLDGFGRGITSMARGLSSFVSSLDPNLDIEKVQPFINILKNLAKISDILPNTGGVAGFFAGNKDLEGFGDGISSMGDGLKKMSDKISDIKNPENINTFVGIIKKMAEIEKDLPNTGGVAAFFAGDQDWGTLADGMTDMADCFEEISESLGGKDVDLGIIQKAVDILKLIASVNTEAIKIDEKADKKKDSGDTEGFIESIVEPVKKALNKIKEYQKTLKEEDVSNMTSYFAILKDFINNLGAEFSDGKTQENLKVVSTIGDSIATLLDSVSKIKSLMFSDKKDTKETGDASLDKFADAIIDFVSQMTKIDPKGLDVATTTVAQLKSMSDLKIAKFETAKESVQNLKDALLAFKDVSNKKNQVSDPTQLATYVNGIKKSIKSFSKGLIGKDAVKQLDSIKDFGSKAKTFADGLKAVSEAFKAINSTAITNGEAVKKAMNEVSKTSVSKFTKGLEGNKAKVKGAFNKLISKAKSAAEGANTGGAKTAMYNVGVNLVQGFINGVGSMSGKVKSKLKSVMQASVSVSMKTLDEHSPSKVFKKLGAFTLIGYIHGLDSHRDKVLKKTGNTFKAVINKAKSELTVGGNVLNTLISRFYSNASNLSGKKAKSFAKAMTQKISNAAYNLYKQSDSYESDKDSVKQFQKDLKKIRKRYYKYKKEESKAKSKDKKKDAKQKKKDALKDLKEAKKNLKDIKKTIRENIANAWNELFDSIKDNARTFLDPLQQSIDTGIDLFTKFERGQYISSSRMLANMKSQVTAADDWAEKMQKLRARGISDNLYNKLKEKGISGIQEVNAFLRMNNAQIKEANAWDAASTKLSFETMMQGLIDRVKQAQSWQKKISNLTKRGLDKKVIQEILGMGIEEAGPYLDALLAASDSQIKAFNKKFNEARNLEDGLAKVGMASYAEATDAKTKKKVKTKKSKKKQTKDKGLSSTLNKEAGKKTAKNYVDGVVKGLDQYTKNATNASTKLGTAIIKAINKRLGIHSPAKEGEKSGGYTVLGLVKGVLNNLNLAQNAGTQLAESILTPLDQLEDTQNSVGENPIITPVLDLDRLEKDLRELDNMFKNSYVLDVAASMSGNGTNQSAQNGDVINNYNNSFTQNNYSPEPLDRVGIYRDTKNFMNSKMKGGVVTA